MLKQASKEHQDMNLQNVKSGRIKRAQVLCCQRNKGTRYPLGCFIFNWVRCSDVGAVNAERSDSTVPAVPRVSWFAERNAQLPVPSLNITSRLCSP